MGPQHDLATLDICIQSVARTNSQASPQWAGKDNLTFRGNLGLHGKTILPYIYAERFPRTHPVQNKSRQFSLTADSWG